MQQIKKINFNIKKCLLQHRGKYTKTLIKTYYNISSTTNATFKKTSVATKNLMQHQRRICCNNKKKLLQHLNHY